MPIYEYLCAIAARSSSCWCVGRRRRSVRRAATRTDPALERAGGAFGRGGLRPVPGKGERGLRRARCGGNRCGMNDGFSLGFHRRTTSADQLVDRVDHVDYRPTSREPGATGRPSGGSGRVDRFLPPGHHEHATEAPRQGRPERATGC